RRGILQVQCWALSWRLVSLLPLGLHDPEVAGQVAEAITALEALLARASDVPGPLVQADLVLGYGALARAHWRRGRARRGRAGGRDRGRRQQPRPADLPLHAGGLRRPARSLHRAVGGGPGRSAGRGGGIPALPPPVRGVAELCRHAPGRRAAGLA